MSGIQSNDSNSRLSDGYSNLTHDLSKMVFRIGNTIGGDDINAILLSLIENFASLYQTNNVYHNLELSQPYQVSDSMKGMFFDKNYYEVVLRYVSVASCSADAADKSIATSLGLLSNKKESCPLHFGTVRFFLKQRDGNNNYTYIRIYPVIIEVAKNSQELLSLSSKSAAGSYQNSQEMRKIEESAKSGIAKSLPPVLLSSSQTGRLSNYDAQSTGQSVDTFREINNEAQTAAIQTQSNKISQMKLSNQSIPSDETIDTAQVVAEKIEDSLSASKNGLSTLLTSDKTFVPLSMNSKSTPSAVIETVTVVVAPEQLVSQSSQRGLLTVVNKNTQTASQNILASLGLAASTKALSKSNASASMASAKNNNIITTISKELSALVSGDEKDIQSISEPRSSSRGSSLFPTSQANGSSVSNKSALDSIKNKVSSQMASESNAASIPYSSRTKSINEASQSEIASSINSALRTNRSAQSQVPTFSSQSQRASISNGVEEQIAASLRARTTNTSALKNVATVNPDSVLSEDISLTEYSQSAPSITRTKISFNKSSFY